MIACPPHDEGGGNVKRKLRDHGLRLLAGISLMIFGWSGAHAQEARKVRTDASGKPPYNIVFLIVDQRTYRLIAGADYSLQALGHITSTGVMFRIYSVL